MRIRIAHALVMTAVSVGMFAVLANRPLAAASDEPTAVQAERALNEALSKED